MSIRGVPFVCPGTTADPQPAAVNHAPQSAPHSVLTSCPKTMLARCATPGSGRTVMPRVAIKGQEALMQHRRATRLFSAEAVPMRVMRELIYVACDEPDRNAPNRARFILVESSEAMARVTGLTAAYLRREGLALDGPTPVGDAQRLLFGGARHMAVAHASAENGEAVAACAKAVARLEWAAIGAGLGACFAGEVVQAAHFASEVAAALAVPQGHVVVAAVLLGYPAFAEDQPATAHPTRIILL